MEGRTCLLRVDLNVEPGQERNTNRLEAIIPTIRWLLKKGKRVVILSHRGRPRRFDRRLTLRPFAPLLQKKLGQEVVFVPNFNSLKTINYKLKTRIFLLENLRFWPGEEKNDPAFARKLAALGDFYVNDAFAVSHRKNASIVAITKYLPSYSGLRLKEEVGKLGGLLKYTTRPFTVIIGGAKISDKIGVIENFWRKADYFLFGGGPANTFFAAKGLPVGDSLADKNAKFLISNYLNSEKIILPVDVKIHNRQILDIGESTIRSNSAIIRKSRTIIWNGPMGLFEKKGFEKGTVGIWKAILANRKARIVVGGGETVASLRLLGTRRLGVRENIFISTGGGAMLEYLSGKKLPGLEVLK